MRFVCTFLLLLWPGLSVADQPRVIDWDDLIPATEPLPDPFENLDMAVRFDLGFVAQVLADERAGRIEKTWPEYLNAMALLDRVKAQGVDTDGLVKAVADRDAEIERRNLLTDPDLDRALVRMPGYALPLETSEAGVTEFLLVPYVGACIHTPPPPPNQIVFVKLETPYKIDALYEPVWITGTLGTGSASRSLSFVDGQAQVATGYTLAALLVEPYE